MYLFKNNQSKGLKVKICGLSLSEDIRKCSIIGVDAVGFLLGDSGGQWPTDKLTTKEAGDLIAQVPASMASVLLIKNNTEQEITVLIEAGKPDTIQLQSPELTPETVMAVAQKYPEKEFIKTIKIQPAESADDVWERARPFIPVVNAILLDSAKGGSGIPNDWLVSAEVVRRLHSRNIPVILAGGLDPNNVQQAVATVCPDMIDLMSRVSLDKGVKNIPEIERLFAVLKNLR